MASMVSLAATAAVNAVIGSLLSKLGDMLKKENGSALSEEYSGDIAFLRAELEGMHQFLFLVKGRAIDSPPDIQTKEWMKELQEVSYDTEDYIDSLRKADHGHGLKQPHSSLNKARSRRRISREIQRLKDRILQVRKQGDKLLGAPAAPASSVVGSSNNTDDDGSSSVVDPRIHAVHADAEVSRLVGVDGPRDELIELLLVGKESSESAAQLKVVSIVGSGGLGKTTLAKQVFDAIVPEFNCGAWLTLSRNPDTRRVLMDLLSQVEISDTVDDQGNWDERDLINKIRGSLQNRRYLLVLDDIWSLEAWDIIKLALPMNSSCSRIITTTRIQSVAKSCCSHWNDIVYEIRPLSTHDSRHLFYTRIFESEDSCPPDLVEISDQILKKCAGIPLAISTISSLLAMKGHTKNQWLEVDNSLGKFHAESITHQGMRRILYLSYCDLPSSLKACLLYLSVFPKGHVITRDRLVMIWIAEGFIVQEPERNLKESGESYFNELINRSIIQPIHVGYDGQPEDCRVHDLVHDFIVSMSTEESFVISIGDQETLPLSHNRIRRLALNNINEKHHIPDLVAQSHMRSLTIFGSFGSIPSFQNFSVLRVLDLEDCLNLENQHFNGIGSLLHLRYLNIRNTPISKIPDQIMELKFLQTLDLRGTGVQELQANFAHLQKLEFLFCDNSLRLPEGIGNMKTLSLMSHFDILRNDIAVVDELGNLSNLRELVIWWSPDSEFSNTERYVRFAFSLYRLKRLKSLSVHGTDSSVDLLHHLYHPIQGLEKFQMNKDCYLSKIPKWLISLPNLAYVCIDVKEVKNEDLKSLSSLSSLIYLSLASRVVPTERLVICNEGFSVLREFHLHSAWANLTFEPESMPEIERLLLAFHVLTTEKYEFSVSVESLKHLKKFDIRINIEGANTLQIKTMEDAIKKAADSHRNNLIVDIQRLGNLVDNEGRDGAKDQESPNHPSNLSASIAEE